jgi:hypothetical protein
MSNTALSSARRRRTGQAVPVMAATTQQQQLQQQRLLEIQRQKQLLSQQQAPSQPQPQQSPYTQRMQAPMQRIPTPQVQIVKADTPVPPGYIKLLMPNGAYQMESVETGSINFPYSEPHLAPTLILRNHDLDIIKLQGYHNDVSNQLAHLTTLVTRASNQAGVTVTVNEEDDANDGIEEQEIMFDEAVIHKITENPAFIANTVSHIMQNTNLSELVTEVNAIKTENRELRSILNSQHDMMNAMNLLIFNLLNKIHSSEHVIVAQNDNVIVTQTDDDTVMAQNDPSVTEVQTTQSTQYQESEKLEYKEKEPLSPIEEEVVSQENVNA